MAGRGSSFRLLGKVGFEIEDLYLGSGYSYSVVFDKTVGSEGIRGRRLLEELCVRSRLMLVS